MRRSMLVLAVLAVFAVAVAAYPAPAAAQSGWIAAGVWVGNAGTNYAYLTGELYISDKASLGIEYQAQEIAVSVWYGLNRGFYGQVAFSDYSPRWEAGVWGSTMLSSTIEAAAWIGATSHLKDGEKVEFTARAEAYVPFGRSLFGLIGVDGVFVDGKHSFTGRVGIGTNF